jgi:acetyl/propionyl-CoA carboxylase alpha subunit
MKFVYRFSTQIQLVDLVPSGNGFQAALNDRKVEARILNNSNGQMGFEIDGGPNQIVWVKKGRKLWLHFRGRSYEVEKVAGQAASRASAAVVESVLRAPMPGQVRQVVAKAGQSVKAGETLLVLEAMKMEIRIQASRDSKVARVAVKQGQTVEREQILVELEADYDR